ncbi:MAG: hypothetical protein ABMA13_20175 [Chthoniobacteraceae bacterium]
MNRPELTIETTPGVPPTYRLVGWDRLDGYAVANVPLWCAITHKCDHAGIAEMDRLKMLCAALLADTEKMKDIALDYARRGDSTRALPLLPE